MVAIDKPRAGLRTAQSFDSKVRYGSQKRLTVERATHHVYQSQLTKGDTANRVHDDDPDQRQSILKDLLSAEKDYVDSLGQLKAIYIVPCSHPIPTNKDGKHHVEIPKIERDTVFREIEKIIEYHAIDILPSLAMSLRQLEAMGHDTNGLWSRRAAFEVAELFNARSSYINDMYEAYGKSVCHAILVSTRWENPLGTSAQELAVERLMQKCRADKRHLLRNLRQYLELPLRRLAHYELFLKHLARKTSPQESPDGLDTAFKFISSLSTRVTQTKRLTELRTQLRPFDDPNAPFYNQTLKFETADLVMEGPLTLVRYLSRENIVIMRDHIMIDDEELLFPGNRTETLDTVYYQHKHEELEGTPLLGVLLTDRLVLLADGDSDDTGRLSIFAVLKMGDIKDNMKLCGVGKTYIRVVCDHNAYYLDARDREKAQQWLEELATLPQTRRSLNRSMSRHTRTSGERTRR
ncbi:uncharacterized protein L203_102103 [Cryptococcus depauperatus CBS 7841]|uniref:Uncharacterized protein n=1 Tax=Cryptococcus depauperatus CBS 7841 TaxID=1295531 RepID=A0A1E3IRE6_9TREE|nr:hypothetical protein L203_01355 [Cryptococcus depauperatus CBS 7841]